LRRNAETDPVQEISEGFSAEEPAARVDIDVLPPPLIPAKAGTQEKLGFRGDEQTMST
jgi:hypothetical protein